MSIDQYRVNAWSAKRAIDSHLAEHRKCAKPMINVEALLIALLVMAILFVGAFLLGYNDGLRDSATIRQSSAEPTSRATKCTSYDIRNGQKYCLTWRRE